MNLKGKTWKTTDTEVVSPLVTRTPILDSGDIEFKREEIRDYFHQTFTLYESLFGCLTSEDAFLTRANRLRHPLRTS